MSDKEHEAYLTGIAENQSVVGHLRAQLVEAQKQAKYLQEQLTASRQEVGEEQQRVIRAEASCVVTDSALDEIVKFSSHHPTCIGRQWDTCNKCDCGFSKAREASMMARTQPNPGSALLAQIEALELISKYAEHKCKMDFKGECLCGLTPAFRKYEAAKGGTK